MKAGGRSFRRCLGSVEGCVGRVTFEVSMWGLSTIKGGFKGGGL